MKTKICLTLIGALLLGTMSFTMQQDPLNTQRRNKSFFIEPFHQSDTVTIPWIGVYGTPYEMEPLLARIKFNPSMVKNAPDVLRKALPATVQHVIFNMTVTKTGPRTYNLIFHPWAAHLLNQKFFNVNVHAGIFLARGVQPAAQSSISFNKLTPQNVIVHPAGTDTAFSPNNVRFLVSNGPGVSSFWTVAILQSGKNALVTFHVLANSAEIEHSIENVLVISNTLGEFLQELKRAASVFQKSEDQLTMQDAIKNIEMILGNAQHANQNVSPANPRFLDALDNLTQALANLRTNFN